MLSTASSQIGGLSDPESSDGEDDVDFVESSSMPSLSDARSDLQAAFKDLDLSADNLQTPNWVQHRNRALLHHLLSLDHPTLTDQMLHFLTKDTIPELLVSHITRPTSGPFSTEKTLPHTPETLALSYRASSLLAPVEGSQNTPAGEKFVRTCFDQIVRELLRGIGGGEGHLWHM